MFFSACNKIITVLPVMTLLTYSLKDNTNWGITKFIAAITVIYKLHGLCKHMRSTTNVSFKHLLYDMGLSYQFSEISGVSYQKTGTPL